MEGCSVEHLSPFVYVGITKKLTKCLANVELSSTKKGKDLGKCELDLKSLTSSCPCCHEQYN